LRSCNADLLRREQYARSVRDNYAELYDNASEALLSVAGPGLIRTANFAAAELLARERTRLVGLPLRLLVHQSDLAELARLLSQGEDTASSASDVRMLTPEGVKTCRLATRRSRLKPGVIYVMLLPEYATDGRA
jgi:PAS domain-containing protein